MASLALSIVSHGQGELVGLLLDDLATLDFSGFESVQILVTLNISEDESFLSKYLKDVIVIRNVRPLGYGANHNQAFASSEADFFIVLNPDIRISESFSRHILACEDSDWGCMAPIVVSPQGEVEDSARRYPTIFRISRRVFLNQRGSDYGVDESYGNVPVDWVAGMFLIFRSNVFRAVKGFDHRYFMYLEDADICKRANEAGFPVVVNTGFSVVHDARRNSFRSATHLRWHLRSMFRFIFGF
jgi:GT2 family glycosyltransferase